MSSPDIIFLKELIKLDRSSNITLYQQVAQQFINAIQREYLPLGFKLPGSRVLSELLQVHRKTIIAAYEDLQAQGWIETLPNKGSFVLQKFNTQPQRGKYKKTTATDPYPTKSGFTIQPSSILDLNNTYNKEKYHFTDGTADIRLTNLKTLTRHYNVTMQRKTSINKILAYHEEGNLFFKEQLANFLNHSRGLHIQPKNILVTRSSEMNLYIIARTIIAPNDIVLVADISNYASNMIFMQVSAKIITIKTDSEGIIIDELHKILAIHKVRALYITPHHQYPTTVTLSSKRRLQILNLSLTHGFAIIEDDYDYEFNYERSAILPLASADINGMVIYTGTFGKSLAPAFKTGFVIAPQNIILEMQKYLSIIDRQGDTIMEQTLGELIDEGEIHRQLKKSLKVYKERRDYTASLLEELLSEHITFEKPKGGLAFWLRFNRKLPLLKIANQCKKLGLYIPQQLLYQNKNITALRMGFGHLNQTEMKDCLTILKHSIENHQS